MWPVFVPLACKKVSHGAGPTILRGIDGLDGKGDERCLQNSFETSSKWVKWHSGMEFFFTCTQMFNFPRSKVYQGRDAAIKFVVGTLSSFFGIGKVNHKFLGLPSHAQQYTVQHERWPA